ncbi:MAG: 2-amino-4-hydroxy-6-hydroxymethyldihydropteridine diphosphokinase [Hyphomicrobium sp.]
MNRFDAALGLGSNVGDKQANIAQAIALLTAKGDITLVGRSRDYRSAPWGVEAQDWFVNAAVTVATKLSARELLGRCQGVESEMGRVRRQKWGPRIIDVDILTYHDAMIDDPDLIVPHPLIGQRAFVLVPLMDVAPNTTIGGQTLPALLDAIDHTDIVMMSGKGRGDGGASRRDVSSK